MNKAEEDPTTGRIKRLKVADVEPLEVGTGAEPVGPDEFWREHSMAELAAEQGITGPQRLDALVGAAADLWEDDDDVEAFVGEIYVRRREGREREEGER